MIRFLINLLMLFDREREVVSTYPVTPPYVGKRPVAMPTLKPRAFGVQSSRAGEIPSLIRNIRYRINQ